MNSPLRSRSLAPRATDLLADRALDGLAADERAELLTLLAQDGVSDDWSLDFAAAQLQLAALPAAHEPMPQDVKLRLAALGRSWSLDKSSLSFAASNQPETYPIAGKLSETAPLPSWTTWGGWALAACLLIASLVTFAVNNSAGGSGSGPASRASLKPGVIAAAPDAFSADWSDWDNPEIKGVQGRVMWSETLQRGVMTFKGLPRNDATKTQYQLWIIDERGLAQRINGAIFDSTGEETSVEVRPSIAVRNAAAFALTIEGPGGTWVSDMTRRVVIAKKGLT